MLFTLASFPVFGAAAGFSVVTCIPPEDITAPPFLTVNPPDTSALEFAINLPLLTVNPPETSAEPFNVDLLVTSKSPLRFKSPFN